MAQPLITDPLDADAPPDRLDLRSLNDLAHRLRCSRTEIESVAEVAGRYYQPFEKRPKPRWFAKKAKPSKSRTIDNPTDDLRHLQDRVQKYLLKPLTFPFYLCGGVKGRSVIDNVAMHVGAPVLVTLDIRSFFPSIRHAQVYGIWADLLGCSPPVADVLTKLTTYKRHLPQGAPTSSLLANLVLFTVDAPIRTGCASKEVTYSTWVDDLAFSGKRATSIIETAVNALRQGGFSVSHKKLRIMGNGGRMILNGVLVGRFPAVLPQRISQLRSGIHKIETHEVPPECMVAYCNSLRGAIQNIAVIAPLKAARLQTQLNDALKLHGVAPPRAAAAR